MAKLFQGCGHESRKGIYARILNPFLPKMERKTERKPVTSIHIYHILGKRVKIRLELLIGDMKFLAKMWN